MGDVYGCLMSGDGIALRYFYHKPRVDKQSFAVQPCTRKVRSLGPPSCWACGGGSRPAPGLHFSCGVFGHGQSSAPIAQGSPPPEAPGGGLGPGQGCKLVWFSTPSDAGLLRWKALFLNHVLSLVAA